MGHSHGTQETDLSWYCGLGFTAYRQEGGEEGGEAGEDRKTFRKIFTKT